MTREEAIECAKNMTYQEAIRNTMYAKGVRYKKATRIKLHELAEIADKIDTIDAVVRCKDCELWTEEKDEEDDILYGWCRAPFENDNLLVYGDDATRIFTVYDFFCKSGERKEP